VTTSKTGKHGHAKANITGLDIFTGKKYQDISPTSHNMTAPVVSVSKWELIDIDEEGYASLMDEGGETRQDLKVPADETGEALRKDFEAGSTCIAIVTKAMDSETITGHSTETQA